MTEILAEKTLAKNPKISLRDGLIKTLAYFDEILSSSGKPIG